MNNPRLTYLFRVYFDKTATAVERDELLQLLSLPANDEQVHELLDEAWLLYSNRERLFDEKTREQMLAAIFHPKIVQPRNSLFLKRTRLVSAIAAILILALAGLMRWSAPGIGSKKILVAKHPAKTSQPAIVPGSNKALLTLADGSKIQLDSVPRSMSAQQGNAAITNTRPALLCYKALTGGSEPAVYNMLSTAGGGKYELQLSDGTRVWLNASSSIYYLTVFTGAERTVKITGEVYFEVAKNPSLPFKVNVQDINIQVLGTHFNVMAYEDETAVSTTLLEGSVKVSKGNIHRVIEPGQQANVAPTGTVSIRQADTEQVMAWKNGWFQFEGFDIEKIMRQVSRWYNVKVVYEGNIPGGHFSGMVSRDNSILQVLKIMEGGGVKFTIEGNQVTVSPDKTKP